MALALFLMMVVIASLVVSVWLLARHREYTRRIYGLEERLHYLEMQDGSCGREYNDGCGRCGQCQGTDAGRDDNAACDRRVE